MDWLGIFLTDYLGYILILATIFLFFKQKKWSEKIYFFSVISLTIILSRGIIAEAIKFFDGRPRPFSVLNFQPLIEASGINTSMPSGHAAFYFALAFVILFFNKKTGFYFTIAAILMGFARIFTGVHWPTDILAGAAIAALSALLVKKLVPSTNIL